MVLGLVAVLHGPVEVFACQAQAVGSLHVGPKVIVVSVVALGTLVAVVSRSLGTLVSALQALHGDRSCHEVVLEQSERGGHPCLGEHLDHGEHHLPAPFQSLPERMGPPMRSSQLRLRG